MPNVLDHLKFTREPDVGERQLLRHAVVHGTSYLCIKTLERDYPLQVFETVVGWCLMGVDNGLPLTRDSEYFESREEAQAALGGRCWTQRLDL